MSCEMGNCTSKLMGDQIAPPHISSTSREQIPKAGQKKRSVGPRTAGAAAGGGAQGKARCMTVHPSIKKYRRDSKSQIGST
jgi:hypothetical protein